MSSPAKGARSRPRSFRTSMVRLQVLGRRRRRRQKGEASNDRHTPRPREVSPRVPHPDRLASSQGVSGAWQPHGEILSPLPTSSGQDSAVGSRSSGRRWARRPAWASAPGVRKRREDEAPCECGQSADSRASALRPEPCTRPSSRAGGHDYDQSKSDDAAPVHATVPIRNRSSVASDRIGTPNPRSANARSFVAHCQQCARRGPPRR